MAKVCYFTGRKTKAANNRSHAMNKTKRTVKPNLQKVTILEDGKRKKFGFQLVPLNQVKLSVSNLDKKEFGSYSELFFCA
ncbi:LSU ribosomal protein L28p [Streptococcus sp. DD12]|nr:LSU ribosomal protein L28p [Streptococcus sp. DD12]